MRSESALTDDELVQKFRSLAGELSAGRRATIEQSVAALETDQGALTALMNAILAS